MGGGWGFDKNTHGLYLRLGTIKTEKLKDRPFYLTRASASGSVGRV